MQKTIKRIDSPDKTRDRTVVASLPPQVQPSLGFPD
jgi:hypothetical protein